jgi:gamma-glutamyltranspeptidase
MKLRSVRARRGMVAAGHPLASAEGLAVLHAGGNAVDAAIAAAAVLAVVSPHECGLGGDLFAVIHDARSASTHALNASGRSPGAATLERYAGGIPAGGPLSVSVPGMVGGWEAAVRRFGSRPLGELLAGAIAHAEEGFPAYDGLIENAAERNDSINADPHCRAMFLPGGRALREGELLRQPAAASTLRAVARGGAQAFYRGPLAESLCASIQAGGGLLAARDMAGFEPLWQAVIEAPFHGYRVCTIPPNSWGAALLLQLMAMERDGVVPRAGDASGDAGFMLQGIRSRRLAYARLAGCIADPSVAGERAREVLARFMMEPQDAVRAPGAAFATSGAAGTDTSNVLAIDGAGNAVSLLQSVFVPFGSGVLAGETGILMNNRMRGFSTRADDPNCVAPDKRPAQTLTPVLVMRGTQAWIACGTPGGPGQTGTVAQFLARVLARGEDIASAIAEPRWSMTLAGDFILEDSAPEAVRAAVLAAEPGVKPSRWGSVNAGSLAAIQRDGEGWVGCVDSRRNAAVLGF